MILSIIIIILMFKGLFKMYRKSVTHNARLYGNYLYAIIRAANSK